MSYRWFRKPKVIVLTPLVLALVLAVACGTASPSEPPAAAPQPAPGVKAQPSPVPVVEAQSTSLPEAVTVPTNVEVHPGKLTIMVGDLANERFDTIYIGGTPGWQNYSQIMHGVLVNSTETRELEPGIATKWDMSADGLSWTFTIRKGVKWHDGSELTPEDVLWTLQHTLDPQTQEYSISTTAIRMSRVLDKIELGGPDEVVLTTTTPELLIETYVSDTTPGYFPIMPKRATLHNIEEELAYDDNPIGAGFMSVVSRTPASVIKFDRFDDFYYQPENGFSEDKRVRFRSLDLFLVPEESTRVSAIRAGEADLGTVSLQAREQVENGGGRLVFSAEGVISQPGFYGCWEPQYACNKKEVRQAMGYAIDKELIRDTLYGGSEAFQVKGWMDVSPSTIGYTPALDPWPFDPDKARRLLADAGYPGGEGFGTFVVNVRAATALPFMVETAQIVAEMWKRELGLDVEIRVLESQDIKARRLNGELNGQLYWEENDARRSNLSTIAGSYGDVNRSTPWHKDPELFALAQETVQILDPDQREESVKKLLERFREESYHIGIGYANTPWAIGPRVLTWQPFPLTLYPSALHTLTLK